MSRSLIVLVGPPGSGKSSVGRRVAAALDVPFRDTDSDIVAEAGKPIPDIFVEDGEERFRELERGAVRRALAEHRGVLALGGGAVLSEETRRLLADVPVVYLSVGLADGLRRVGVARDRPVLALNPRSQYRHLLEQRRRLYEEVADVTVATDGCGVRQVSEQVLVAARRLWDEAAGPGGDRGPGGGPAPDPAPAAAAAGPAPTTVRVGGDAPYDVVVGFGVSADLGPLASALAGAHRVAVVHQEAGPVRDNADRIARALTDGGIEVLLLPVPDAEAGKTLAVAGGCWDALGAAGFTRSDAVVGVGGGAATDLAGFVAAAWLRGVRCVLVPTTLLGMVDAAVGGKTGINTAEGKNLVGAFHPPSLVVCDLDALAGLPPADYVAGLAEVVKCGFIADPVILDMVEENLPMPAVPPEGPDDPVAATVAELVRRAVAVKARVVSEDLRESGLREILNYGHTLAHAIERAEGYRVRHGEAVAVGMTYAAELARLSGRLDEETAARHGRILRPLGLPTTYAGTWEPLHAAMAVDKKTRGATLRFVVLDGLAEPGRLEGPEPALLEQAFAAVSDPEGWPGRPAAGSTS